MSYLVLARKWRPKTFDEVVGQSTVTRTLKNALASGRIGHAFLLSGARGVGKTTTARILAKALNCVKGPVAEPCGECPSCVEIAAGTSLDVQEIDGATHNGVEQVRELRESARYNPARDRFKIWIIDEVHMLSTGAFNALLKTLEEPPPRSLFIFATTNPEKIPFTVVSRCQRYDLRRLSAAEILERLRKIAGAEQLKISDTSLFAIAREADGSLRDAQTLLDQVISYGGAEIGDAQVAEVLDLLDRRALLAVLEACIAGDPVAALAACGRLAETGSDAKRVGEALL
ncbi:MAG TPA: DNA polymerase III subunit gamma/tau, partial [Gemmatimonadota bacterium]